MLQADHEIWIQSSPQQHSGRAANVAAKAAHSPGLKRLISLSISAWTGTI
jgi:hypothetical protein